MELKRIGEKLFLEKLVKHFARNNHLFRFQSVWNKLSIGGMAVLSIFMAFIVLWYYDNMSIEWLLSFTAGFLIYVFGGLCACRCCGEENKRTQRQQVIPKTHTPPTKEFNDQQEQRKEKTPESYQLEYTMEKNNKKNQSTKSESYQQSSSQQQNYSKSQLSNEKQESSNQQSSSQQQNYSKGQTYKEKYTKDSELKLKKNE